MASQKMVKIPLDEARKLLKTIEFVDDDGPPGMGWKSDALSHGIGVLEEAISVSESEDE